MAGSEEACYQKTNKKCVLDAPGFAPVNQQSIYGYSICGKQGYQAFKDAIRPNSDNQCPSGTSPCSQATSAGNTVCASDLTQCPITDVKFVAANQVSSFSRQNYVISSVALNGFYLATSKSSGDNLPIRATKLDFKVCAIEDDIQTFPGECFYSLENVKASNCGLDPNNRQYVDTRYQNTQLVISEYALEFGNGVLQ